MVLVDYIGIFLQFRILLTDLYELLGISWPPVLVVEEAGVPGENH
jgi:hypothetical protein